MGLRQQIIEMEAGLSRCGVSVAKLCAEAGIAETTWGRWKKDEFFPSWRAWKDVDAAFSRLTSASDEAA